MIHLARTLTEKIEKLTRLPVKRLMKFGFVGGSGIVVNMSFFYIFNEFASFSYKISFVFAFEISIINNFILNTLWTWKDRKTKDKKEKKIRFFKYHLITLSAALINFLFLWGLVEYFAFNKYLANLIGIFAGMSINFLVNHKWTFKKLS